MRKALLLGIGVALVIILLLFDSEPVTSTAVVPPNPAVVKAGLVPEGTLQVIVVTTDQWSENKAQVAAFERAVDGQPWRQVGGNYSARIGQNGFTDGPSTRTDVTPSGSFGARQFVRRRRAIPARRSRIATVDALDCWITDRQLVAFFDHWVAAPGCDTGGFGDALLDPDGPLQLAIVTDHDATEDPTLPRRVFLRCYDYSPGHAPLPTSGDVSMRSEDVHDLLLWLDPAKSPRLVLGVEDWLLGVAERFVGGAELWRHRRGRQRSSSRRSPPRAFPPRSMGCSTTRPRPTSRRSRNGRTCRRPVWSTTRPQRRSASTRG